jgi:hypothetical protein
MNTMTFPFMLSPILGGVIVALFGYTTLFVIGLASAIGNWLVSVRLEEPRHRAEVPAQELITA